MIVFDLKCVGGHVFEAWFASSAAYEAQRTDGQLSCPMCGNTDVDKAVMAPAIAAKGNRQAAPSTPADMKAALAALAKAQAAALEGSQWVGSAFADRARAMHAGEEDVAAIHGQATLMEAKRLVEDGVPVAPLPLPVVPPDTAH
jgi:hypothetical protein